MLVYFPVFNKMFIERIVEVKVIVLVKVDRLKIAMDKCSIGKLQSICGIAGMPD
ncbi:hypothetical protein MKQ70_11425 [Chitinophaga sedimenti]|nr:hypothetical protein [Chitinophaga sedimenti]MCK7555588.1 hypothetical protein [Chitinophaga sedimenti]